MPGINYRALRQLVSLEDVLDLLDWLPSGPDRGACPVREHSRVGAERVFWIDRRHGGWYCHACHRGGNQLDLWAAYRKLSLHAAAVELCERTGVDVPWRLGWGK